MKRLIFIFLLVLFGSCKVGLEEFKLEQYRCTSEHLKLIQAETKICVANNMPAYFCFSQAKVSICYLKSEFQKQTK